ncbi:transposase [Prosthecochloris sp. ZM]|uniref:transposase n=1 Tax=Prosthecochloris sp. ZM TaxID=2283143 RepID=UPI000DF7C3EA|nr:transposase [Prosthecochloris sp. ZM]RDD31194.1 transposase [Prosthecochloris sp. ZM]
MRKQRKNHSSQERVFIIMRHLVDHVPVSDLYDEYDLQPNVFYRWQKEFFENGSAAFEKNVRKASSEQKRIEQREAKIRNKNDVLSELMKEHVKSKKDLGNL